MGIEWLKPGAFFGSILYALIGVAVFWLSFVHHRQAHPVQPVAGAGRKAEHGARHRGRRHGPGHVDHRGGRCGRIEPRDACGRCRTAQRLRPGADAQSPRPVEVALLASVFVVAACGLVYELAAGALASYVLGDSVLQFSTIIGTYLFAMGVGSWLSRFFERQLPAHFLRIELLVALVGGSLPALLFIANAYVPGAFRGLLYGLVLVVGIAGRAGDSAGDAHPQAQRRAQGPGVAGAHLRLPGRAGGVGRFPAAAGAAAGPDPHRPAVRADERGGGAVGALAVPP